MIIIILGPLITSEYYSGWIDYWMEHHSTKPSSKVAKSFDDYLSYQNASVNVYMAHGGTSFGFEAGIVKVVDVFFIIHRVFNNYRLN